MGQAKVFTRKFTNFTFRHILNPALDLVSVDTIRKYYRKGEEYEKAYRDGKAAGKEVEELKKQLKLYKSHRRIFNEVI